MGRHEKKNQEKKREREKEKQKSWKNNQKNINSRDLTKIKYYTMTKHATISMQFQVCT